MPPKCKLECIGIKVRPTNNYYKDGLKYCKECEKFIKVEGYRCYCCNGKIRTSAKRRVK